MRCNINYPGGIPIRIARRIIKGKPFFDFNPKCAILNDDPNNLEEDTIDINGPEVNSKHKKVFSKLMNIDGVDVYLHGSQADFTDTEFSDYDDLVIVDCDVININNRSAWNAIKALNIVDINFCRLDPLQHHGHWLICKKSLYDYDASYIPLVVLHRAMVVSGPSIIKYRLNKEKTKEGLKCNIENTCNNIRSMAKKYFAKTINLYELKGLVGSFALIPSYIYQTKGLELSKPEAIKMAGDLFPKDAMDCIQWSTEMRDKWGFYTKHKAYRKFSKYVYLFTNPFLYRRFASKYSPVIFPGPLVENEITNLKVDVFINVASEYV